LVSSTACLYNPAFAGFAVFQARELRERGKYRATIKAADLVVIDDLFLRKLPPHPGDELADLIMSRYEKSSTRIRGTPAKVRQTA
jgi:hypothetical protein